MSFWNHMIVYQNGEIEVGPFHRNQPVQGNHVFTVHPRFGFVANKIDLQSYEGSTSTIWNYKWFEPWRGAVG